MNDLVPVATVLTLGFGMGLRHAMEADLVPVGHVAEPTAKSQGGGGDGCHPDGVC